MYEEKPHGKLSVNYIHTLAKWIRQVNFSSFWLVCGDVVREQSSVCVGWWQRQSFNYNLTSEHLDSYIFRFCLAFGILYALYTWTRRCHFSSQVTMSTTMNWISSKCHLHSWSQGQMNFANNFRYMKNTTKIHQKYHENCTPNQISSESNEEERAELYLMVHKAIHRSNVQVPQNLIIWKNECVTFRPSEILS